MVVIIRFCTAAAAAAAAAVTDGLPLVVHERSLERLLPAVMAAIELLTHGRIFNYFDAVIDSAGGGVASTATALVASTKLLNVEPG